MLRTVSHLSTAWTATRSSVRQLCTRSGSTFHITSMIKEKHIPRRAGAYSGTTLGTTQGHRANSAVGRDARHHSTSMRHRSSNNDRSSSSSSSNSSSSNSNNNNNIIDDCSSSGSSSSSNAYVARPSCSEAITVARSDTNIHGQSELDDSRAACARNDVKHTRPSTSEPPTLHDRHADEINRAKEDDRDGVGSSIRKVRAALQVLMEVEQIKATKGGTAVVADTTNDAGVSFCGREKSERNEARRRDAAEALTPPPSPAPASALRKAATTVAHARSSAAPAVLGKLSWIRNKRAKFWATVHPTGAVNNEMGTVGAMTHKPSSLPFTNESHNSRRSRNDVTETRAALGEHDGDHPLDASARSCCIESNPSHAGGAAVGRAHPQTSPLWTPREPRQTHTLHSAYKTEMAHSLAELLDCDADVGPVLLEMLSADSRRLMLVMGTASEYFSEDYTDVIEQIKEADRDGDDSISANDYDEWARSSFMNRRQHQHVHDLHTPQQQSSATGQMLKQQQQQQQRSLSVHDSISTLPGRGVDEVLLSGVVGARSFATSRLAPPLSHRPHHHQHQHQHPSVAKSSIVQAIQRNLSMTSPTSSAPSLPVRPSESAMQRLRRALRRVCGGGAVQSSPSSPPPSFLSRSAQSSAAQSAASSSYIPWNLYLRLLFASAAPFLAFGMLDNATLILAGDATNRYLAEAYGFSSMTSAGVGGVVSGVAGIQVHGLAERCTRAAPPVLTAAQQRSPAYERSSRMGNTLGMVIGLILGMLPLFFLDRSNEEKQLQEENDCLRREAARHRERCTQQEEQKKKKQQEQQEQGGAACVTELGHDSVQII